MKTKTVFTVIGVLAGLLPGSLFGQGKEVKLLLNNGWEIVGELLSVRDTALVISLVPNFEESMLEQNPSGIIIAVRNHDVLNVTVQGKSNVLKGMGIGILAGAGTGALLGFASGDDPSGFVRFTAEAKAVILGIGLGGVGFIVGTIVGIASSTHDKVIEPLPDHDFSSLTPFARFAWDEPEFLKKIN